MKKEGEVVKMLVDPKRPGQAHVDLHRLMGHVEYRNWCEVCVKARGKELDHSRDEGKERKLPEYGWDYSFPGDELGFRWTVLGGEGAADERVDGDGFSDEGGHGALSGG